MRFPHVIHLLTLTASYVSAQATHTVTVGVKGSFYDPPTISALQGDIVTFVFGGIIHGVTQSSFDQPCSPLPGGFSSGFVGTNGSTEVMAPTWSLVISNASGPIWFFCEATRPLSHCASGMVGAINPPSSDMYNQFRAAAKAVSGTPAPTPQVVLTGIGAFATASPTTISTSPSSVTVTASPTSTGQNSVKNFPIGAVAGGVGGGVAIVLIAILLYLLRRKKTRAMDEEGVYTAEKEDQIPSTPPFKRGVSESVAGSDLSDSDASRVNTHVRHQPSTSGFSSNVVSLNREAHRQATGITNTFDSSHVSSPITMADAFNLSPSRHPYAQPQYIQPPSPPPPPNLTGDRTAANVHEIAKEVAALLRTGNSLSSGLTNPPVLDSGYSHVRQTRQLPTPRHFLRPDPVPEEPHSPALPRYEQ